MGIFEYLDHVNSKEDLLKFLVYLQKDFKVNQDEWENIEVETYLEALHGWLGAYEGVYINQGGEASRKYSMEVYCPDVACSSLL